LAVKNPTWCRLLLLSCITIALVQPFETYMTNRPL